MPSLLLVDDHPVVHVALEAALMKSSRPYRLQAAQDDVRRWPCWPKPLSAW